MKKRIALMVLSLLCCTFTIPAMAAFQNPAVVDDAGYLTQSQTEELTEKLDNLRETYDFDVAIYTESSMTGSDAMNTADDIFDYNGYGAGDSADGILLYVSANPREYWFSTHGSGMTAFNDNGLAYLEKQVLPGLQEDDYYAAFSAYADYTEELLEMAAQGKPYNKKQHTMSYVLSVIAAALLVPLALAFGAMHRKLRAMKTAVEQNYAADYMKPGSMKLQASQDIFLYSTVTKTEKPKSNSGSHTSSSGESHGGRGGSF